MPSLERRFGEAEREEIFSRAAEYLRLDCGREEYLACVGRGMFALVCQCGSREAAQQRAEGLIRGLDGYLAGFRAEYAGAFRAGICSLSENPDCSAEAALYNARQGCAHAFRHGNALRVQHARHDRRERAARASARQHEQGGGKGRI